MPSKNPDIIKKHRDAWYAKNKRKQIQRQMDRRKELNKWLLDYKREKSCSHCGMSFKEHPECCDFHHIDPETKKGRVSDMVKYSKKKALEEIDKCITLCANCHRTVHKDKFLL